MTFPIQITYKDRIVLARKLLDMYSVLWKPMTDRTKDILTVCLLVDMNNKSFNNSVISYNIGFKNIQQVKTALSRTINEYEFIYVDELYKKKHLCKELAQLKAFIDSKDTKKEFLLDYAKKT